MMKVFRSIFFIAALALKPTFAGAESVPTLGMTYHEVVKLLGAPESRREYETNRQVVWIYQGKKVLFKEGKVFAWSGFDIETKSSKDGQAPLSPDSSALSAPQDAQSIRAVLEEILSKESEASSAAQSRSSLPDTRESSRSEAAHASSSESSRDSFTMGEMLVGEALKQLVPGE